MFFKNNILFVNFNILFYMFIAKLVDCKETNKKTINVFIDNRKCELNEYYDLVRKNKLFYENTINEINNQIYYKHEDLKKLEDVKNIMLKNIDYYHKLMREINKKITEKSKAIYGNNKPEILGELIRESLEIEINYNQLLIDMEKNNCEIKNLKNEINELDCLLDKKVNILEAIKNAYEKIREFNKECHEEYNEIFYDEDDDIFKIEYLEDVD